MKKLLTLAMSLALAGALTACGGVQPAGQSGGNQSPAPQQGTQQEAPQGQAPQNHLEEIKANGKIVLGTSADYPPFEFHQIVNGEDRIVGWEMEMAEAIAEELGVELEIKEGKFETLLADLNTKKVDFVISGMSIDLDRQKSVDFSEPYWKGGQVVLTRKADVGSFTKAEDLSGKVVGAQLGSTGEEAAKGVAGVEVKSFDAFEAAILDLISGRVDAVVADYAVAVNYEKNNQNLAVAFELSKEDYAAAFRKGDTELLEAVNQALAKLEQNGTIDQLIEKYEAAATE